MATSLQIFFNISACKLSTVHGKTKNKPINFRVKLGSLHKDESFFGVKLGSLHKDESFPLRVQKGKETYPLFGEEKRDERYSEKKKKRMVMVRLNQFGLNGGGGGNDEDDETSRVLTNLALAIGLAYLTLTGQLGWIFDTILSIGLFVVVVPIVGIGAFIWWAGRDIVQSTCPSCGNEFQMLKSTINDETQSCPYCAQPFTVEDNKFVKDSMNQSTTFSDAFKGFPRSKKGKEPSNVIVDIEAEVKDVD